MTIEAIRILAWPAFSNAKSNLYQSALYSEIAKQHQVADIFMSLGGLKRCLTDRRDIMHIHWIERAFWARGSARIAAQVLLTMLIILILKARGTRIVWTAHDAVPHEMAVNAKLKAGLFRLLWLVYRFVLVSSIDGVIYLSATHIPLVKARFPRLGRLSYVITPHPHYRAVYPNTISRSQARDLLGLPAQAAVFAFVGKLRPYKNVDGLLQAFRAHGNEDARLLIAGEPDTATYGKTLSDLAAQDSRVALLPAFVPDERLQYYLNAADVVLLPFHEVTNSGSLLLALSFDRPVAVPNIPVFREIQDLVGSDWIYLFDGPLTAEMLNDIAEWAGKNGRSASPPMDSLGCPEIAAQTLDFYNRLLGRGSRGLGTP